MTRTKDIVVVQIRELSYEDAKKEIMQYIEKSKDRNIYISEIVKELRLDIELVIDIVTEWKDHMCKQSCKENIHGFTSYNCPIINCRYNNYLTK